MQDYITKHGLFKRARTIKSLAEMNARPIYVRAQSIQGREVIKENTVFILYTVAPYYIQWLYIII